jgi:hypothetical protein
MPTPWSQVAESPAYRALPPEQQEAARVQYFQQVVAPQVPPENLEEVRQQFDAQTGTLKGPGIGRPAAPDDKQAAADLVRSQRREPMGDLMGGVATGIYGTGVGVGQFAAHANPVTMATDAIGQRLGLPSVAGQFDDAANRHADFIANDPGSQSAPGKVGNFVGGMIATAPDFPVLQLVLVGIAIAIVVPIVTYPLTHTLWSAVDLAVHPPEPKELAAAAEFQRAKASAGEPDRPGSAHS